MFKICILVCSSTYMTRTFSVPWRGGLCLQDLYGFLFLIDKARIVDFKVAENTTQRNGEPGGEPSENDNVPSPTLEFM